MVLMLVELHLVSTHVKYFYFFSILDNNQYNIWGAYSMVPAFVKTM